jgi:hypothetical protein
MSNKINGVDADDVRFRIKPYQQLVSSVAGALTTSLLSKFNFQGHILKFKDIKFCFLF